MTYKLLKNENIENIGDGFLYEHIKTGAKIVYIKNTDKNKVFSISFRTLPENNTGVFHILEHCVLCGSKKYPLKEPFNQLDKCTINTYLNAITFADKTLYPIASTNDKDYFKLLDVYLDAVFFPLIEEKEGIFLQEGWHYNGKEVNGVVYNEMKGAYSTPDAIIDFKVKEKLFKNKTYANDSGGHPDYITNLTYEQFIKTYKKYYSPSNSIIYFYGDLDIEYYLKYLDEEYLSKFDKGNINIIEKSENLSEPIIFEDFYFTDEDDTEEKNYMQASFKLNFSTNEEKNIAFDILSDILTENQEGILKKSLVDAGICTDVTSYIDDDMIEPVFTILIEGTKENDINKFKNILEDTIKNIVIDDKLTESSVATVEFYFKEKDFGYKPKGLFYNITLLKNMLYEKYNFDTLKFDSLIENVKQIDFKQLLIDNILNNKNAVYCVLKPTNEQQIDDKIYKENIKPLVEYQKETDKQEDIDKIPPLDIKDIDKEIFKLNTEILEVRNRPLIFNSINSEILYFNMNIDISDFSYKYGQYISIYVYLLGKLSTKNYTSEQLEQTINILIGGGSTLNGVVSLKGNEYFNTLGFSARILNKNIEKAFNIINEIFKNTNFEDKQNVKKFILEFLYKCELDILKEPKQYSIKRAKSYICEKSLYIEKVEGIDFYYWLKNLCKNIDENIDNIIENLIYIQNNILNIKNAYFGIGCRKEVKNNAIKSIENLTFFNDKTTKIDIKQKFEFGTKNEAFYIPSDVNYNSKVAFINKENFEYTGYINILKRIIQSDYIWYKIRTEGGAYGGDMDISNEGLLMLNSYSDPNILETYKKFDHIGEYIKNINISEKELHMYKISAINILDRPFKNNEINQVAMAKYFKQTTDEKLYIRRQQILNATLDDIKSYFEMISQGLKQSNICTIGNREDINLCKEIFSQVKTFN